MALRVLCRWTGAIAPAGCPRICARMSTATLPAADSHDDSVFVQQANWTKTAVLNRPKNYNALTTSMVSRLMELYERWEKQRNVHFVIIKGRGRAFCAGIDLAQVYYWGKEGLHQEAHDFFKKEYLFDYLLATYRKPHIAIMNGMVMDGGSGISIPGKFRVATENCIFAMPEACIGFHPDAGASFFLSRLPGFLGEYLALTGERLDGGDMIGCGLATHFINSHKLGLLEEQLNLLRIYDPDSRYSEAIKNQIDVCADFVEADEKSPVHKWKAIDKCFSKETVEEILVALIRLGRQEVLSECLVREYRTTRRILSAKVSSDFYEGCRAFVLENDNQPKWHPPVLEQVTSDMVDQYFLEVNDGEELELPVAEREPLPGKHVKEIEVIENQIRRDQRGH
ncbi:hypothetical protein O6H91_15G036900 [Diphasiastrum complanatum]|uniref:Uncharacterized protein n=1 Tax=Diphasiastrum complanatum TaxID=34168 RepID=A0ACC2BHA6_DIPCM|nr:hypothetical protein O6H91_15G036900 [Diphasiastrum complanatum]